MKNTKHFLKWLLLGLGTSVSFKQYMFHVNFVGPKRSMFDECNQMLNDMEKRFEDTLNSKEFQQRHTLKEL